jgi:hypothetical protein
MNENIVVEEKGSNSRAVIGIAVIILLIVLVFFAFYSLGYWTPPVGDDSGPNPRTWYKTTIVLENEWVFDPFIERITHKPVQPGVAYTDGKIFNPLWDENCILAVEITFPNGKQVSFNDKNVWVGNSFDFLNEEFPFYYSWYTTQSGMHAFRVSLYSDENGGRGKLYESQVSKLNVGGE